MQHLCKDRPDYDPTSDDPAKADAWVEGDVTPCPYHGERIIKTRSVMSRADRRKADRAAGKLGTDRGGYISG